MNQLVLQNLTPHTFNFYKKDENEKLSLLFTIESSGNLRLEKEKQIIKTFNLNETILDLPKLDTNDEIQFATAPYFKSVILSDIGVYSRAIIVSMPVGEFLRANPDFFDTIIFVLGPDTDSGAVRKKGEILNTKEGSIVGTTGFVCYRGDLEKLKKQ